MMMSPEHREVVLHFFTFLANVIERDTGDKGDEIIVRRGMDEMIRLDSYSFYQLEH